MAGLQKCLELFGWALEGVIEQYLRSDEPARAQQIFGRTDFTYSAFGLPALIDDRKGTYAEWGFYEEGLLVDWGDDQDELLAALSRLELQNFPET
jgi:hypothetical protein